MNKLRLAAIVLPIAAIFSLLLIAVIPGTGNGQISLGGEKLAKTTPVLRMSGNGGYTYSNLLWLSSTDGTADVSGSGQTPIYIDTGAWQIAISGDVNSVSWRETPDEIVITISGTVPYDSDSPTSAHTY